MAEECFASEPVAHSSESTSAWGQPSSEEAATASGQEGFDDDFVNRNNSVIDNSSYQPLPDTTEYIKSLETKLKKVQKSGSLASNLSAKRADEARRLLDSAAQSVNADLPPEIIQDPQIQDNPVLRTIFPEKQAVAQSELIKLVHKDDKEEEGPEGRDSKDDVE